MGCVDPRISHLHEMRGLILILGPPGSCAGQEFAGKREN